MMAQNVLILSSCAESFYMLQLPTFQKTSSMAYLVSRQKQTLMYCYHQVGDIQVKMIHHTYVEVILSFDVKHTSSKHVTTFYSYHLNELKHKKTGNHMNAPPPLFK